MFRLGLGRAFAGGLCAAPQATASAAYSMAPAVAHRAGPLGGLGRAALPHVLPAPLTGAVAAPARGFASRKHKKLIKMAKGYRGRANSVYSVALQRVTKALQYAYRDRKVKKREFRKTWIERINAAGRQHGIGYSRLINGLERSNIELNRKVLADLAVTEPMSFKSVIATIKQPK